MADRIPFRQMAKMHRTMAEVDETERLKWMSARGWKWGEGGKARRLYELLNREEANNPPVEISPEPAPGPEQGDAA